MKFEFNEKGLKKLANEVVRDEAKKLQSVFNSVSSQKGRPVADVKARLRMQARRQGFNFSDRDLTDYAKAISEGTKINVTPKKK